MMNPFAQLILSFYTIQFVNTGNGITHSEKIFLLPLT